MQRMVDFVRHYRLHVRLAYYPPYHSKYHPIERCWGILEHHWNGAPAPCAQRLLSSLARGTQLADRGHWLIARRRGAQKGVWSAYP